MNDVSLAIARNMFHLQIHEADGQRFEDLFAKVMQYKSRDFQAVKPHGNIGDRKNDGWIENENTYFQVYAPENIKKSINDAVSKLRGDFEGLYEHWDSLCKIKNFYFVLNDKYKGSPPQLQQEMLKIKSEFGLDVAKVFVAKDLEFDLFDLREDMILSVVGHIPHIDNEQYMFVSGFTCFITAWIDFEKVGRNRINNIIPQSRPIVGKRLITELHKNNLITHDHVLFLMLMADQRNRLVHGDTLVIPRKSEIDGLVKITETL
ncbi:hypothetical protein FQP88_12400 [Vibrio atlanticus]|nr:hypothetical protein FQP88_12400 [Vibrio atlanticus]